MKCRVSRNIGKDRSKHHAMEWRADPVDDPHGFVLFYASSILLEDVEFVCDGQDGWAHGTAVGAEGMGWGKQEITDPRLLALQNTRISLVTGVWEPVRFGELDGVPGKCFIWRGKRLRRCLRLLLKPGGAAVIEVG